VRIKSESMLWDFARQKYIHLFKNDLGIIRVRSRNDSTHEEILVYFFRCQKTGHVPRCYLQKFKMKKAD
jgi:hypothetical protein